jgi:hypothetical protein
MSGYPISFLCFLEEKLLYKVTHCLYWPRSLSSCLRNNRKMIQLLWSPAPLYIKSADTQTMLFNYYYIQNSILNNIIYKLIKERIYFSRAKLYD